MPSNGAGRQTSKGCLGMVAVGLLLATFVVYSLGPFADNGVSWVLLAVLGGYAVSFPPLPN